MADPYGSSWNTRYLKRKVWLLCECALPLFTNPNVWFTGKDSTKRSTHRINSKTLCTIKYTINSYITKKVQVPINLRCYLFLIAWTVRCILILEMPKMWGGKVYLRILHVIQYRIILIIQSVTMNHN